MSIYHLTHNILNSGITIYTNKEDTSYEDGNTYILRTDYGLIMFDCGCGETLIKYSIT